MKKELVLEIDVTHSTLSSEAGDDFLPDGKEYVIIQYDDETNEVKTTDYGYQTREQAERAISGVLHTKYRFLDPTHMLADKSSLCPNCSCHYAERLCHGCDEVVCQLCWAEHNEDAPCHVGS